MPTQRIPAAQLNLKTIFPKHNTRLLGLTPYRTAILIAEKDPLDGVSTVAQWNIASKKITKSKPLSIWLDSYDFQMSPNGVTLVTNNSRTSLSFPHAKAYRATALRSSDLQTSITHAFKENRNISEDATGYLFSPNDSDRVVMKMISNVPNPKTRAEEFDRDTFQWLNLKTGKREKTLVYNAARGCDRIVFSPDKKYLLCLFQDETADTSDDPKDLGSIIDVLDAKSGKTLWHIQGTSKRPAGNPLFFISPTHFIAYGTVFNIPQRKSRLWNAVNPSRRCLEVVPGNSRFGLFLTASGLQLRDWKTDRALASWPTITKPGRILFSPDLKAFAFRWGQNVQFWKFDPKWLK